MFKIVDELSLVDRGKVDRMGVMDGGEIKLVENKVVKIFHH